MGVVGEAQPGDDVDVASVDVKEAREDSREQAKLVKLLQAMPGLRSQELEDGINDAPFSNGVRDERRLVGQDS